MNPIQQKEVISQGEQLDKDCAICFDAESERIAALCGHIFHQMCLNLWLTTAGSNGQCPLCRRQLAPRMPGQLFQEDPLDEEGEEEEVVEEGEEAEIVVVVRNLNLQARIVGYEGWDD